MGSRNNKPGRIVKGTALQPSLKSASGVWSLDEAMQAHRANAWPQPDLFQPVANSLRFKNNTSYVTKQVVRQGNQRTFTVSLWVKRDSIGTRDALFNTCNVGGNAYWGVEFGSDNALYVYDNFSSTLTTTQVFRDTSAWYHIVVAVDTLQSTSSNRTKVYVNGAQVTSFSSAGYPAQGLATRMNGIDVPNQAIGSWFPSIGAFQYDGYITEVNFIDGYQLDPSLFGKFDTNNTWVPVPYTGTYGTNGFYLPFTNATTSQTLGYDASLTGTTTYDADQDPYRGNVALHLTGNGPAGGNNNVFADSSSTNNAISRTGNITQGSFSPYPLNSNASYNPAINGASAYFPKSGWLSAPTAAVSSLGTGDFTFESWVYPLDFTTTTLFQRWFSFGTGLASDVTVNIDTSGNLVFRINDATQLTSATSLTANAWNHVAFVRSSGTVRFYINGVSGNSASVATNISTQGGNPIIIGAEPGQSQGSAGDFYGYMSNFRIIKGVAVYTANFTPAMRPFGTLTNNLLPFSEDIANATWTAQSQGVNFTPSAAIAPDGTPSATLLVPSTSSASQNIAGLHDSSAGVNTFSIYAKSAGYRYIQCLHSRSAGGDAGYVTFDLTTGAVTNSSVWSGSMANVGNGWYRLIATTSSLSGASANSNVRWAFTDGSASRGPAFTGNGTSGIYVWGAQAELASSVGEYTPTPTNFRTAPALLLNFANAAVVDSAGTRNFVTTTNASITASSKYGQGALYFDGSASTFLSTPYSDGFSIGASDYTVEFWCNLSAYGEIVGAFNLTSPFPGWLVNIGNFSTAGKIAFFHANATVNQTVNSTNTVPLNTWTHIAVVKQNNFLKMFINGQLDSSHSLTLTSTGSGQQINIGSDANSLTAPGRRITGSLDDLRITKGVARYQDSFTPPARALPEVGGKSFVTTNVNAGVVRSFTTVGTTSWTAPTDVTQVEVLVVAGGGGSGGAGSRSGYTNSAAWGGGGGAGGLIYNNQYPVTPGLTYTVTVGAGGAVDTNGSNSIFGNLTAIGGGAGGDSTVSGDNGNSGGSGGGGGGDIATAGGAGTAGQGFAGGAGQDPAPESGGGGGGAGGAGSAGATGAGGAGLQFGISGTPTYYAGGGGGGAGTNTKSTNTGGLGGGGNGTTQPYTVATTATGGTANTGGGGGGGPTAGGSGIVIVRYTTTAVGNTSDATSDNLVDSPTQYGHDMGLGGEVVGNYCTLNPIDTETDHSFSNGNLTLFKAASNWSSVRSTMAFSSGKWYFETTYNASWDYAHVGVLDVTVDTYAGQVANSGYVGNYAKGWAYQQDQRVWNNGINIGSSLGAVRAYAGDTAMVAVDMDTGKIWFGVNGVWFNSGNPAAGTNAAYSNLSGTVSPAFSVYGNSSGITVNFGQRAWAYAPPAGFNAITTKNLPRPAVGSAAATPNQFFDAALYTGTGAAQTITLPGAFQPDLVWMKARSAADNHVLMDSVRGTSAALFSDLTNAEVINATRITSFNSNGFTLGSSASVNTSSATYVAWCWRAGGAAVSNTSGTLTSQVSANTASGFSVVTYTGTATSGATVGHGLSAAPELIITKVRNQTDGWYTYTTVIDGTMDYFQLNTDAGKGNSGLAVPTSTVFYNDGWSASYNMLAYCFHSVAGYSKIGTYVGNGSADGPFIYTGFKPRFVMVKCSSTAGFRWIIWDTARDPVNFATRGLSPNLAGAEVTAFDADILSNGFKLRDLEGTLNTSGDTYIYMAIADKPFGNVNGVSR